MNGMASGLLRGLRRSRPRSGDVTERDMNV
jgi:hypothetical protein